MQFPTPLVRATLVKRYKRFLADVVLPSGEAVVAHCANSGSMLGCAEPGATVYLSENTNPKAKLDWRWELVEVDGTLVAINTSHPNRIVEEAILGGLIPELAGFGDLKREVKYQERSRIDLLLSDPGLCFVEVKNVTLKEGSAALFPDAVTARGAKHLEDLMAEARAGNRAAMLYIVNRNDCDIFAPADHIDPNYGALLREASKAGVEILAYQTHIDLNGISVAHKVRVELP